LLGEEEDDDEFEDEENVEEAEGGSEAEPEPQDDSAIIFDKPKTRRDRQSGRFGLGLGKPPLDGKFKGLGKGKGPFAEEDDGEEEMDDAAPSADEMEVDAEDDRQEV